MTLYFHFFPNMYVLHNTLQSRTTLVTLHSVISFPIYRSRYEGWSKVSGLTEKPRQMENAARDI
jgi:hypothetical protein